MSRVMLVLLIIIHYPSHIHCATNVKFEAILENATVCSEPHPPYPNKTIFLTSFKIHKTKEATILSGQHRLLVELPFRNFSASTFKVLPSGALENLMFVDRLNCRSWLGRLFLTIGRFRYSKKNCRLSKGTVGFADIDINKIFHSTPNWHTKGMVMHRTSLVHNGSTVFCHEVYVMISEIE